MMSGRTLAALLAACLSSAVLAGPFSNETLVSAPGIMPDGGFSFALRVDDDDASLEGLGIPSGTLITHVHLIAPDRFAHVDGPEGMRETLVGLSPGDKAVITVFPPGSKSSKQVTVYLPSYAELRTARLDQRVRDEMADARIRMEAGDAFGSSYWGVRLRLFSLGYFDALRFLLNKDSEATSEMIDVLTGRQAPWVVSLVEIFTKMESRMSPYQGVISAYGITRTELIGDCGEAVDNLTATRTTWTEYRNSLGHYRGSTSKVRKSRDLSVPKGFGSIVSGRGNPDVSVLVQMNLGPIVRSLGCDSIERRRMEANMLSFFRGSVPSYRASMGDVSGAAVKP